MHGEHARKLACMNKGMAHGTALARHGQFRCQRASFVCRHLILAGVIQLIPQIRERAPVLHR